AKAEHTPGLRFRGDFQGDFTVERRHFDRAPEGGRGEAHRHLAAQMLTVALEYRVLFDSDLNVQVTGRPAVAPRLTLAAQTDTVASINARGNLHRQLLRPAHTTLAEAGIAGILDDGTVAAATGTGLLELEEALGNAHL